MKTILGVYIAVVFSLNSGGLLYGAPTGASQKDPAVPPPTAYSVVGRDANSRVWERTTYELSPSGSVVPQKNRYTELATGLHYNKNGQWVESKEKIDILPNGTAAATQGQHQVHFPGDIYDGVIELVTPDGKHLRSRPVGLSYDDGGNTVLIAELTNSVGYLVGSNQVIYPDAFTGVEADLRYTYTKAGFEQDIILRAQPPTPESLGLNPQTARLQILTEFFNPPRPNVRTATVSTKAGKLINQQLDFGVMKIRPGKAFLLGTNSPSARVNKQWLNAEGRQFLVEEVPVLAVTNELLQLPAPQTVSTRISPNSPLHLVSAKRLLPAQRLVKTVPPMRPMQLAQAVAPSQGLVLDYQTVNGGLTNYTFQGGTTYFISGPAYLYGANTFEGGAVIKYQVADEFSGYPGASLNVAFPATVQTLATPYRPVIFTCIDDTSVGEDVGADGGPGSYNGAYSGTYANPALSYDSDDYYCVLTLDNFRIAYAVTAISATAPGIVVNLNNRQIAGCGVGFHTVGEGEVNLKNMLFANDQTALSASYANINAQNVTFSATPNTSTPDSSPGSYLVVNNEADTYCYLNLVNCILANVNTFSQGEVALGGDHNGFYNNGQFNVHGQYVPESPFGTSPATSTNNPFQTAGGGNYYLTNGCSFINAGTTNIDAALLAGLRKKTTCPPIFYSNRTISVDTTLNLQAQRDTNAAPALGYHYDPIDYMVSYLAVENATLTLANGVAIAGVALPGGGMGQYVGIYMMYSKLTSLGTAQTHNQICTCDEVQEQRPPNFYGMGCYALIYNFGGQLQAQFTDFDGIIGLGGIVSGDQMQIKMRDCRVVGPGNFDCLTPGGSATNEIVNNLFERTVVSYDDFDGDSPLVFYNNLVRNSSLCFGVCDGGCSLSIPGWVVRDNLFDNSAVSVINANTPSGFTHDHNAYLNTAQLTPTHTNDIVLSSFTYTNGPLGNYYQLSTNLVDKGSTTADQRGLYHYTTQISQAKETNSIVDIGYHYVAVDQYGNPIDTHGEGIPDYVADANGNGLVDNGETPWLPAPTITVQPADQTVYQSSNATFSVTATSLLPMIYQWTLNGTNVPDATNSLLFLTNVQYAQAGNYAVAVTNSGGKAFSSNAVLTVVGNIVITQQPLSQEVLDCDTVTFAVEFVGNTNVTYQWMSNDVAIAGATDSSYTINNVQDSDAGDYAVTISDGWNSLTSSNATLWTISDPERELGEPPFMIAIGYLDSTSLGNQRQNYTFKSGVTYWIRGPTTFHGKTTIEAGAVIKPDWWPYDGYNAATMEIEGTLTCKGEPYYPAVLTSVDDDSVGYSIRLSYFDGPPQPYETGVAYLELADAKSNAISNLRICYADYGVSTPVASRKLDVWDCQFVQCNYGVVNLVGDVATNSLHNVLFADCGAAVGASTDSVPVIEAEQVTADVYDFCLASSEPIRIALTNSIVWGNPVTASDLSTNNVAFNPDVTNFQPVGAGCYYLAANSPLHAAGTANISPRLQTELQRKTTCAPAIATSLQISGQMTLSSQAPRYTNGAPDLGYYYDALDYTVADVILSKGGSITVLPGTAIGFLNEPSNARGTTTAWGFDLREGSSFVSHGTPAQPNIFVDVQFVQEQMTNRCVAFFVPDFESPDPTEPAPFLDFRFCNFYVTSGWTYWYWDHYYNPFQYGYLLWAGCDEWWWYAGSPDSVVNWNLRDCAVHGGKIQLGLPTSANYVYGSGQVSWMNNLFDRVNINLQPTYYLYNQVINCDMQVQAYNNLFRDCQWFLVDPVPASAGNWGFKDNLFDRVNFYQDTDQPLALDNNAYWPLAASDLAVISWEQFWWGGNSAQLTPTITGGGANEVTLTAAPPYQTRPFGNYYLPNTTPLYGAGSDTPANLGLYHYTTRLDQMKEGNDTAKANANIGLHYIAATNLQPLGATEQSGGGSTFNYQPIDTDGDGIPDYVEDANGNGVWDQGTETDWRNPMTDNGTPDPYNTIYDNVDLDGDGLTGAAERFFGTNPLIPDNPLNLLAVPQQSTLSGIVQIPLNISTNVDTNTIFTFMVNGIAQNTIVYQTNGNWFAVWDTTAFANGSYLLSMEYDLDEDTPVIGATKFVNAQNDVCFPNSLPICGGSLFVQPQTINTNGTYTMDVYDDQTNLFASLNGDVDGNGFCDDPNTGQPGITVNLQDTNGNQWPSEFYAVQVTTYPALASAQSKNRIHSNQAGGGGGGSSGSHFVYYEHPWSGNRMWVIAFQAVYGSVNYNNPNYRAASGLAGMLGTAVGAVIHSAYGPNNSVNEEIQTADGESGLMLNDPDNPSPYDSGNWNQLAGFLTVSQARNFYYYGHGSGSQIGKGGSTRLTHTQLQNLLQNSQNGGDPLYTPNLHAYRFVFLDGCNTANGSLSKDFGIPNCSVSQDDWDNKYHLPPRAFLGWPWFTGNTFSTLLGTISPNDHFIFVENFFGDWSSGQFPLQNALTQAGTGYINGQPVVNSFATSIVLYGCPTLPFYQ